MWYEKLTEEEIKAIFKGMGTGCLRRNLSCIDEVLKITPKMNPAIKFRPFKKLRDTIKPLLIGEFKRRGEEPWPKQREKLAREREAANEGTD